MQINLKKTASTLIEVVLVMTILGIIAALTVPGLMKHSQRIEMASMVKKAYFTIDGALSIAFANEPDEVDTWMPPTTDVLFTKYLNKHLNVMRTCTKAKGGCFGEGAGTDEKESSGIVSDIGSDIKSSLGVNSILLVDGVGILPVGSGIWIDVNADGAPNKKGVDIFYFNFVKSDSTCTAAVDGTYRFCPGNAQTSSLMENAWKITYW